MRVLRLLLSIVVAVWALFSLGQAGFKWWEVSQTVHLAVAEVPASPAGSSLVWPRPTSHADRVRSSILRRARDVGVLLSEDRVAVEEDPGGLRVRVRWVHPVLTIFDEIVMAVPLWIDRTYSLR
jgi:hypothetical protein